jgi:DNA repair exonuclease SbcCD ATPase subunit
MRLITFKSLQGKNFLSFGDKLTTIKLQPGVNAITGTNLDKEDSKNGAGKSAITEMLYYALYGSTLREINKDYIQNSVTEKQLEVSLTLDVTINNTTDEYKITRKLNPTKCLLLKNGEDITRSTLAKTNKFIQDLIHTPSTVFQNSVIMTVNNAVPFMALSKVDKRKFIESVLNLEVFTQMLLKARDDHSIIKKDYEIAYTKLEQNQNELSFNETQLNNYESIKQDRLTKLQDKKKTLEQDILKINQNIEAITVESKSTSDLDNETDKTKQQLNQLQEKNEELNSKLHKIEAEKSSEIKQIKRLTDTKQHCPTCNRTYSDEHKAHVQQTIKLHENAVSEYEQALEHVKQKRITLKEELATLQKKHDGFLSQKFQQQKTNNELNNFKTSLLHLKQNLNEVEEEISHVSKEQNNELKGKVTSLKTSVENEKIIVQKLNQQLNVLETVKFVLSEEGIKSYIVKKILKVLNARLAYYLQKLETNCLCQFNEFFEEEIIDEKRKPKSYFNFSGGERKRIDLACLFAFADIRRLQGDVYFSTVFYDELLDSSLDDRGVLLTFKILQERYNENYESCYLITHRGPDVISNADNVIHVTKQNGISTISH